MGHRNRFLCLQDSLATLHCQSSSKYIPRRRMPPSLSDLSPHSAVQREAISAGLATLVTSGHPRARLTMACGTGKTFTQLKLSEALLEASGTGPRRILVLVPSLSLVRQSRDEWASSHALGADYDSLCVCSDPSLKAGILQDSGEDHVDLSPEDLADIARINAWLDAREKGPQGSANATSVIFTTYQSAKVVGMAMAARAAGDRAIDVGVFDEAHRTAGAGGKPFSFALSDKNISESAGSGWKSWTCSGTSWTLNSRGTSLRS